MTKGINWLLLLLLLTACAAPPLAREQVPAAVAPNAGAAVPDLRLAAAALPGAEVGGAEPLTIRYPGQTLFTTGAVLPLAGGTWMLDPLAVFLAEAGASRWQGTVRAVTGVSAEYDLALAQKRAELLSRYFSRRGIGPDRLTLRAEAASGPAFELARQD
jgi:hypothetical protein